ncbi:MAG TPA: DUF692 family protein [Nitrospiraceae bacterium]|nr:DUF692 family protein [Nitrospiraceae bacterium]
MIGQNYSKMVDVQSEFEERAGLIAPHGLGLSVDLYTPDLIELDAALRRHGVAAGYYEVFQASLPALALVRERLSGRRLAYHGEGLWVTQPDFCMAGEPGSSVQDVCLQLRTLQSAWLNIECAAKQMAGYSFGTYLPPLYTEAGALVAADNAAMLQRRLDEDFSARGLRAPLVLLEMPPLTYFACGPLPIPEFFATIVGRTACGLVLDIGHLWTVYRYTGAWRHCSLERYTAEFLAGFPLEQVIEIHVAGLAPHPLDTDGKSEHGLPRWIDAHGAPIPALLFDLLDQVLNTGRLVNLKAIALEVDTKDIPLILSEYQAFRSRFQPATASLAFGCPSDRPMCATESGDVATYPLFASQEQRTALGRDYARYAGIVTGHEAADAWCPMAESEDQAEGLTYYRQVYLPHEILHWGGDVRDMFPRTYGLMEQRNVDVRDFAAFWFRRPRFGSIPYDFFLLKIECFAEFIAVVTPDAIAVVSTEADELRAAYEAANRQAGFEEIAT